MICGYLFREEKRKTTARIGGHWPEGCARGTPVQRKVFYSAHVGSAIHGTTTITDAQGHTQSVSVVVLADRGNLCASLKARPDYFKNPPEAVVTMVLTAKADQLGSFQLGATNGATANLNVTAGPGTGITQYGGIQGFVAVTRFDPGGEAAGSFDVIFVDKVSAIHEIYGKYKTQACASLNGAALQ